MVSYYKNSLAQKGTGVKKRYNNGGNRLPDRKAGDKGKVLSLHYTLRRTAGRVSRL